MNQTNIWYSAWSVLVIEKSDPMFTLLFSSKYLHPTDWSFWLQFTTVFLTIIMLFFYFLVLPVNIKRDLSDVGFDYLADGYYKSPRYHKKNKKELVKETQKLRKIGDIPPAFPNGWFPLLESDDLKINEVKDVTALGEHFAVFRNDKGEVKILDAYCPHLGANMAIGGGVRGNCLECPFHSWRFDGDTGQCRSIPYAEKVPSFIKVKTWPAIEVNSFIFVWYHVEDENPSWFPQDISVIKTGKWYYHGRSEFLVGCHIQDISENGGDIAHLNSIHAPNLLAGHDLRFFDRFYLKFVRHIWRGAWQPSSNHEHLGQMSLTLETRVCDKISLGKMEVKVEQVGPAYAELRLDSIWGPMIILQAVTPVEPLLQKIVNRIYAPPKYFITAKLMLYGELIMFERDIMIWNHKKYLSKPQLIKEEKTLSRHRRWYGQFYSNNSFNVSLKRETLDW